MVRLASHRQAEPADVYILETQAGDAAVYGSLPQYREGMTEEEWEAERTIQFQGDPHKYEVTYREPEGCRPPT